MSTSTDAHLRLPWHAEAWARLARARADDRLPHAMLITGLAGVGKAIFAQRLARALVCEQQTAEGDACGHCRSCDLTAAGTHPDVHRYAPEEDSKVIKVEAIRALTESSVLTVGGTGRSVYVVDPADAMNTAAANALLKTLEEPAGGAVLLLLSGAPDRLPATIRSRCQRVSLGTPAAADGAAWLIAQGAPGDLATRLLSLYGGAPLAARAALDTQRLEELDEQWRQLERLSEGRGDAVALAGQWDGGDLRELLRWMTVWVQDLIRVQASPDAVPRFDPAAVTRFQNLANRLDCQDLHRFLEGIYELRRRLSSNINSLLAIEKLLLDWTRLTARTG